MTKQSAKVGMSVIFQTLNGEALVENAAIVTKVIDEDTVCLKVFPNDQSADFSRENVLFAPEPTVDCWNWV